MVRCYKQQLRRLGRVENEVEIGSDNAECFVGDVAAFVFDEECRFVVVRLVATKHLFEFFIALFFADLRNFTNNRC